MFKKKGYINVDGAIETTPDMVWDLDVFPYPFPDGSADLIEADHLLEHLKEPFKVMKEFHRILKKKGILIIKVPHSSRGFTHPDHKRGFDVSFPLYFQPDFQGGYCGVEFDNLDMKLNWFAQPYLKKQHMGNITFRVATFAGKVINLLAGISPYACSKVWCYWVGGFDEIEYKFRK